MTKKLNFVTFAISPVLIKFYFLESRTRLPLTETVVIVLYSFNRDWKHHPNLNKIPSLPCLQIPTGHNESTSNATCGFIPSDSLLRHKTRWQVSTFYPLSRRRLYPRGLARRRRRRESPPGTWHESHDWQNALRTLNKKGKKAAGYEIIGVVLILPISLFWKIIHQEGVILQQRNICVKTTQVDFTGQLNYGLYIYI